MSRRTYSGYTCWLCGKSLASCNGLAVYNHNMGHVRRDEMVIRKWIDGHGHLRKTFDRHPDHKTAKRASEHGGETRG